MLEKVKVLIRPEAIRTKMVGFKMPTTLDDARAKLAGWADRLKNRTIDKKKETELLPTFLSDIFGGLLGYREVVSAAKTADYSLKRETLVEVDGKKADATLGYYGIEQERNAVALEGKGPQDPLDRPFAGRKYSAVDQALRYAINLKLTWYIVTNLREIRLYSKQEDQYTFERFRVETLAENDAELKRFVFLLGRERVCADNGANHLDELVADSRTIGQKLTVKFYGEYRKLRNESFELIKRANPGSDPQLILQATQKLLDRILFIAFCEDRGLLPTNSITKAFEHKNYGGGPVYNNFKVLFHHINVGEPPLQINKYNGKLYAHDSFLDELRVPDGVCENFNILASYEYGQRLDERDALIDVDILGHVFEQSISDLEDKSAELAGRTEQISNRKQTGAFYTPPFITRYIVRETLTPVVAARFEAFRKARYDVIKKGTAGRTAIENPRSFDAKALRGDAKDILVGFWRDWIDELKTIRIIDPSCGSGAFLIEAFEQMSSIYGEAVGFITDLIGSTYVDVRRTILEHNLYGVDLNESAVGIARLSCWIQTAEPGKTLSSLDKNFLSGNSLLGFDWPGKFPAVFASGGFDVVVGNPPYVRQEWITDIKPQLQETYQAYDGKADLFVYFYELASKLLKPGGRIGYIVTNKWLKAGYGANLRKLYAEQMWVEQLADFGHAKQIFPDADVFPCILVARKPDNGKAPNNSRVCVIPRDTLRIDDLSRQIEEEGFELPRKRLTAEAWNLEPPAVAKLMDKLRANGVPLKEYIGVVPCVDL